MTLVCWTKNYLRYALGWHYIAIFRPWNILRTRRARFRAYSRALI
jgi:hypothetical protein